MTKVSARPRRAKRAPSPPAEEQPAPLVCVPINGGHLDATRHEGRVWASIRRVCETLDLDMPSQRAKLRGKSWATMVLITMVGADKKPRPALCIDLDALPMWLATIEPARVKPELRPKLELYQKTAARVLRDHFFGRPREPEPVIVSPTGPSVSQIGDPVSPTGSSVPPSTSLALLRIRAADRVLVFVEQDLSMLERLLAELPREGAPQRSIRTVVNHDGTLEVTVATGSELAQTPVVLRLKSSVRHGLDWVSDVIASTSGPSEGVSYERWKALSSRWRRLTVSLMRFV